MMAKRWCLFWIPTGILVIFLFWSFFRRPVRKPAHTVMDQVQKYHHAVKTKLMPQFQAAGVAYPPDSITLLAFKNERVMELWSASDGGKMRYVKSYPILAASGVSGPKLREGDRQVPEGIYRMEWLNPNSRFHLSMRINYPNEDDMRRAREDGREIDHLGSDIMIHGGSASIGCLAVGDPAIEELFVLTALTGVENARVIIAPCDFRNGTLVSIPHGAPDWTPALHDRLRVVLQEFITKKH